ncbi:MAG: FecR family protein, partial [Pirellulales bacterium]|nr:FecR family protein [Pirellulales bacterium]
FVIGGTKAGGTEAQGREAGSGEPVHPSSFILHPSNSGYLILGKLVARCEPPESKGFAIFTPNARVVDLGTEFGIEVDERGSEVAVLTGEVELTSAAADGTKQTIRLAKDEGASVAAESGSVVRHETADVRMIATMRRRMHRIHEPIPDNLARIKSITGSHGGDKYAPGGFYSMTNRSGMSGRVFNDPTTWTNVSTHYKDEWQATTLLEGATNGKIAWLVFDLGEVTERLDKLHLWNVTYANGTRGVKTYNIYYASAPEAQLSVAPEVGKDGTDYDFSSGGWTPLDGSGALTAEKSGKAIINLGSISARYIGVEILASYDDSLGRVGLAEVAIIKAADDVHPTDGEPNENKTDIELAPEGEQ